MADYSWIFSTISQSTAAIAGLFGAFLLSKLLSRESEYLNLLQASKQYKIKEAILKNKFSDRYFQWYNKKTRDAVFNSNNFENFMKANELPRQKALKEIIKKFNFSEFDSIKTIQEEVENYKIPPPLTFSSKNPIGTEARISLNNNLNSEYELIKNLIRETEEFIENTKLYIDSLITVNKQRNSFLVLLSFLILLMNIGVIYPISFMPLKPGEIPSACTNLDCNINSFRFFYNLTTFNIVAIMTVLLNLFMAYFIYKSYTIYFPNKFIKNFDETVILENFSNYLENRKEFTNFKEN